MGFVSITCSNCAGEGMITAEFILVNVNSLCKVTCTECEGTGSHLVHAGQIGSYKVGVDLSGTTDEAWAVVWERQDDHILDVLDMMFRLGEPK